MQDEPKLYPYQEEAVAEFKRQNAANVKPFLPRHVGKSFATKRMIEELRAQGAQVLVLAHMGDCDGR